MAYQGAYIKHPQSQTLHRHTPPAPTAGPGDSGVSGLPLEAQQELSIHPIH